MLDLVSAFSIRVSELRTSSLLCDIAMNRPCDVVPCHAHSRGDTMEYIEQGGGLDCAQKHDA